MLKITKRNGGPSISHAYWKHLGQKHQNANLSDTCLSFLENMGGCFERIVIFKGSVTIEGSELHVQQEISERDFCDILKHAQWIDKVKIDAGFKKPKRHTFDGTYRKKQLTSLDVKSTVEWGDVLIHLLDANRESIKVFKYKELKSLYNLRVFEYNGDKIPRFSDYVDCPRLRKLVVPPTTPFRLWQINIAEKTILAQKNSRVYVLARSNTLRDEAILYTLWGLKKNGFPKDVIRLIMPLVVVFGRECWREAAYKELLAPIEGWVISRHQPEMWARKTVEVKRVKRELEEKDAILQAEQAKVTALQNTVGSLKENLEKLKEEQAAELDKEILRLIKRQKMDN